MWNDAVFPSLSSPLSSSFAGNTDPWLLSSNASSELERLNCGNFFGTLQENYSDCLQLQIFSPPLEPNAGFITGDGDPMMAKVAAGSVACSDAGSQPKVVADRRKRLITGDPVNKYQTTSHPSKRLKTGYNSQKQHHLPLDESTMATTPLVKAPVRRNQKLGDKVTALQQLVSPFGKTDTASVLHEAALSIKFLHEQIRMLANPYFGMRSSEEHVQGHANIADLQSRGLCLVPLSAIVGLMDRKGYDSCWLDPMDTETDLNFY